MKLIVDHFPPNTMLAFSVILGLRTTEEEVGLVRVVLNAGLSLHQLTKENSTVGS